MKEPKFQPKLPRGAERSIVQAHKTPTRHLGTNPRLLREWWHDILRQHGRYSCFAIFLLLPADLEAIRYLEEYLSELDQVSGDDCLTLVFTDESVQDEEAADAAWPKRIREYVMEGFSVRLAAWFGIKLDQLPGLLLFRDIRSADHVRIDLQGLDAEEIAHLLRSVFTVVGIATGADEDPLLALEHQRKREDLQVRGQAVISTIRKIVGKTLEEALKLAIKTWFGTGSAVNY